MKRSWLIATIATIGAATAFGLGIYFSHEARTPGDSGAPAGANVGRLMATRLFDLSGHEASLARWHGKPLIVNFWATWCPPCLAEMPLLSRLQQQQSTVQIVGIAVDTTDNVRKFAESNAVSYPLLVGSEDVMSVMVELGNGRQGLPFTVGIDATGQIRHLQLGAISNADAERLVAVLK